MIGWETFFGLLAGSFFAGGLGSMFGLGGGFIMVPLLAVFFGLPMHTAVATSLLCIVATSQSAALAKASSKYTDVRLGIFLEIFTVIGAIGGGVLASALSGQTLKIVFSIAITCTSFFMFIKSFSAKRQELDQGDSYKPKNYVIGSLGGIAGGLLSTLLGVGGGIIKVPILRLVMGVPFRVAVATSNFMIGITAATGAIFYFGKGFVDARVAFPCVLGVIGGAYLGGTLGPKIKSTLLEKMFVILLLYFAAKMFLSGMS